MVSKSLFQPSVSAQGGNANFTTSWWALNTIKRVASSPRRLIPLACPRPSRSMPKQRVSSLSQVSAVISDPFGVDPGYILDVESGFISPVRNRDRRKTG